MRNPIRVMLVMSALTCGTGVFAQAPAASDPAPVAMSATELNKLVGPIALFPDDLVAIILPASTYPVEVVQADRFLERRKTQKDLPVEEGWQDSIKALLNYPEVLKKMSTDLDWTVALGEAVVADQNAVLQAVQRFRRQTQSVGNLKTDDKQTVVVEKEVIKIVPSNPEVIYVPQYNPTTVVVSSPTPVYSYAPAPYPVYYYPYAPGAALATGMIWGAAMSAAWSGGRYETNYSGGNNTINVNREQNVNRTDVKNNMSNRAANRSGTASQQSSAWRSEKKPGQVSGSGARPSSQRVGDAPSRGGGGGGGVAGAGAGGGAGSAGGVQRSSARTSTAMQNTPRTQNTSGAQGRGGDAFSGYGSGQNARADSARGAASRQSASASGGYGNRSGGAGAGGGGGGFSGGGRSFSGGGGRGGGRR